MNFNFKLHYIFLLLITITSCSPNTRTFSPSKLSFTGNSSDYIIYKEKNGYSKIHQKNGITIIGKLIDGKFDGDVDIIYRDQSDLKNLYKAFKILNKSLKNVDDFILKSMGLFDRFQNSNSKNIRGIIFTINYKVHFKNGALLPSGTIIFQDGLKINTKLKISKNRTGYINDILAEGVSDLVLNNGHILKVNILNNKITELLGSSITFKPCENGMLNLKESTVYNACIEREKYQEIAKKNIQITKKYLRGIKSKSRHMRNVRSAELSLALKNKWLKALKIAKMKVDEYNSLSSLEENKLIGRVYSVYDNQVRINPSEFFRAWTIASPIDIHSKTMFFMNDLSDIKVKLDFENGGSEEKYIFNLIKNIVAYSTDVRIIKNILTKDSSYLENNVYYLMNYNGSPFIDGMGNLYLSKRHNYSEEELNLVMLHEAVHVTSFSIIKEILYNNSLYSVFNNTVGNMAVKSTKLKAIIQKVKKMNLLRDSEEEDDMIVLSIIKDNSFLRKKYLSLIESSRIHDTSDRKNFVSFLNRYYDDGGSYVNLVKTMILLKVVSSYYVPKYRIKKIPMNNKKENFGINSLLTVESLDASYNIKIYDITDNRQLVNLALKTGMNKNLAMALIKHNSGAYFTPNFSIFTTASIDLLK